MMIKCFIFILGMFAFISNAENITMQADQFYYDITKNLYVAKGNISLKYEQQNINADQILYDKKNDAVLAIGHVKLVDKYQNIYYIDELYLRNTLKQGVINYFHTYLKNGGELQAKEAVIADEDKYYLESANYTACKTCVNSPAPLWSIESNEIILDRNKGNISHYNSFFKVKGKSIFYLPYFVHPSPEVKRRSGFLSPKYVNNTALGLGITTPYYFNVMPQMDLTLKPTIYAKQYPLIASKFRHLTSYGQYNVDSSVTLRKNFHKPHNYTESRLHKVRWHIKEQGNFDLPNNFFTKTKLNITSDKTYLQKYDISDEDYLESILSAFKTNNHNYYNAEFQAFQNLRLKDDEYSIKSPFVLPMFQMHHEKKIQDMPGYFTNDLHFLHLLRNHNSRFQRVSDQITYILPYTSKTGQIFTLENSLRGDIFYAESKHDDLDRYNHNASRLFSTHAIQIEYPLIANIHKKSFYISPMMKLIYSPYGINKKVLFNEDSPAYELSYDNLFLSNKFNGLDKVEEGLRGAYGMKISTDLYNQYQLYSIVGQAFQKHKIKIRDQQSYNVSDYVGYLQLSHNFVNIDYSSRINKNTLKFIRQEINLGINLPNKLTWNTGFSFFNNKQKLDLTGNKPILYPGIHKNIYTDVTYRFNSNFQFGFNINRNLSYKKNIIRPKNISMETSLQYDHDCLQLLAYIRRDNIRKNDVKPAIKHGVQISLKTLN